MWISGKQSLTSHQVLSLPHFHSAINFKSHRNGWNIGKLHDSDFVQFSHLVGSRPHTITKLQQLSRATIFVPEDEAFGGVTPSLDNFELLYISPSYFSLETLWNKTLLSSTTSD